MTKADIIELVAQESGSDSLIVSQVIEAFF